MLNNLDFSSFHKAIQIVSEVPARVSIPLAVAIYMGAFRDIDVFSKPAGSVWIVCLYVLMVALFLIGVISLGLELWRFIRSIYLIKKGKRRNTKVNLVGMAPDLLYAVRRKARSRQKIQDYCDDENISAILFAFYSQLNSLGIETPPHQFGKKGFNIPRHLAFLEAIYPLIRSGRIDDLRKLTKQLDEVQLPKARRGNK